MQRLGKWGREQQLGFCTWLSNITVITVRLMLTRVLFVIYLCSPLCSSESKCETYEKADARLRFMLKWLSAFYSSLPARIFFTNSFLFIFSPSPLFHIHSKCSGSNETSHCWVACSWRCIMETCVWATWDDQYIISLHFVVFPPPLTEWSLHTEAALLISIL